MTKRTSTLPLSRAQGVCAWQCEVFGLSKEISGAYAWSSCSTDFLTTGNVMAKFLREEQNASTVFKACIAVHSLVQHREHSRHTLNTFTPRKWRHKNCLLECRK